MIRPNGRCRLTLDRQRSTSKVASGRLAFLPGSDRQRIAASDEKYAELLELHTAARKRPPHPDGNGLREVMRLCGQKS